MDSKKVKKALTDEEKNPKTVARKPKVEVFSF